MDKFFRMENGLGDSSSISRIMNILLQYLAYMDRRIFNALSLGRLCLEGLKMLLPTLSVTIHFRVLIFDPQ